eukprot:scaffold128619_cov28-Tisochrysis_lutea.AAC.5
MPIGSAFFAERSENAYRWAEVSACAPEPPTPEAFENLLVEFSCDHWAPPPLHSENQLAATESCCFTWATRRPLCTPNAALYYRWARGACLRAPPLASPPHRQSAL